MSGASYFSITNSAIAKSTCDEEVPLTPSQDYQTSRSRTDAQYAVRVAQNLFAASAAFAVRMTRRTHKEMRSCHCRVQKQANHTKHWSSCIWQEGRTHSTCSFLTQNCDERDVATQYTNTRGGAALLLESLKTISVPISTQLCDTMGLHPEFTTLRSSGLTRTFR